MLVDADSDVDVPVVLAVVGARLEVVEARLVRLTADRVFLLAPATPAPGARVIVTVDRNKLLGKVLDAHPDGRLEIARDGAHASDDRAAPRVRGRMSVRWRELRDGGPGQTGSFDGTTELSVSGMLLPTCACAVGTRLELELRLGSASPIRAIAIVRRHDQGAAGVEFAQLDDEAADGLADFTIAHL